MAKSRIIDVLFVWECEFIQSFWHNFETWLKNGCAHIVDMHLTLNDTIFGIYNKQRADVTINFIILSAKQYIYRMKYNNTIPILQNFIMNLILQYKIEKYIAYCNCDWDKFNKRWMLYKNLLNPTT